MWGESIINFHWTQARDHLDISEIGNRGKLLDGVEEKQYIICLNTKVPPNRTYITLEYILFSNKIISKSII